MSTFQTPWICVLFALLSPSILLGQNRRVYPHNTQRNIQRAEQQYKEAQAQVDKAKKQLAEIKQKAQETNSPYLAAKTEYTQAKTSLRQVKSQEPKIIQEVREKSPIQKQIAENRAASQKINLRRKALREKILKALLKENTTYKNLQAKITPAPPKTSKQVLEIKSQISKIEQKTLSADTSYTALLNEAKQNHAQWRKLNEALSKSVQKDPKVAAANQAVQEAGTHHKQSLAALKEIERTRSKISSLYNQALAAQKKAEKNLRLRRFQLNAARSYRYNPTPRNRP